MEGDQELRELYREVLLDYAQSESRKGRLSPADVSSHGINPVCGDEIELSAKISNGRLAALRHEGHGCVISQASAAMMSEALEGATLKRAEELAGAFKDMMFSKISPEAMPAELEPLKALEGVRRFPMRVKCATLAWNALVQGLTGRGRRAEYEEVEA